jgi:hypothetical protein
LEGTLLIPDSLVCKNKLPLAFIIAGVVTFIRKME